MQLTVWRFAWLGMKAPGATRTGSKMFWKTSWVYKVFCYEWARRHLQQRLQYQRVPTNEPDVALKTLGLSKECWNGSFALDIQTALGWRFLRAKSWEMTELFKKKWDEKERVRSAENCWTQERHLSSIDFVSGLTRLRRESECPINETRNLHTQFWWAIMKRRPLEIKTYDVQNKKSFYEP